MLFILVHLVAVTLEDRLALGHRMPAGSPARQPLGRSPPGVIFISQQKKVIVTISSAEQRKKAQTTFNELFRLR